MSSGTDVYFGNKYYDMGDEPILVKRYWYAAIAAVSQEATNRKFSKTQIDLKQFFQDLEKFVSECLRSVLAMYSLVSFLVKYVRSLPF